MVTAACGGGSAGGATGRLRQGCYPNGTCNTGLTCLSEVCVDAPATLDAGPEAAPEDASAEAATPYDGGLVPDVIATTDAPTCTAIMPATYGCGAGSVTPSEYTTPSQFCQESWQAQTENQIYGTTTTTPAACRCQETYTCACIQPYFPPASNAYDCGCGGGGDSGSGVTINCGYD